jgi:hypothetical protein
VVEESGEGTGAFQGRVFRAGIPVSVQESGDQGLEAHALVVGGEALLDGVE